MFPLHWFVVRPCPLCRQAWPPHPAPGPAIDRRTATIEAQPPACESCCHRYGLSASGRRGLAPLPWWGAGTYADDLRHLLLSLRRHPRAEAVAALALASHSALLASGAIGAQERPWLVAVPSWKRRANPLPPLVCQGLERRRGLRQAQLLERSRPVLGQHRLGRALRQRNQEGAFRCLRPPAAGEARRHPLLIVDDILTSGATARNAAAALTDGGWRVLGLLCLARTPARTPGGAGPGAPSDTPSDAMASGSPLVP